MLIKGSVLYLKNLVGVLYEILNRVDTRHGIESDVDGFADAFGNDFDLKQNKKKKTGYFISNQIKKV